MAVEDKLERIATAQLKEMGDIRIDDVLEFIDRGIENWPSYMDLYHRWETQQWRVSDLDFTSDRELWEQANDVERNATLWSRRLFFQGEERVTATLAPFVWAAPTPEMEIFLSTQMVDEARHTVFFDRWWREVPRSDATNLQEMLDRIKLDVGEGYTQLFYDRLPGIAQQLANDPRDVEAFAEGVTIYHIVVEATLALTGQRFELETIRERGFTHTGFYAGFTAVARDESRHVNFGIKVLHDLVQEDAHRFAPIIQRTLVECLPLISGTLHPPDQRYLTEFGHSEQELLDYAMSSLNKRLQAIGINLAA